MTLTQTATFSQRSSCICCGGKRLRRLSQGRFDAGLTGDFINSDPWGEHPARFLVGKTWEYVICEDCGMTFHRNLLTPEWNERRFEKWMSQAAIEQFEQRLRTPARDMHIATNQTAHVLRIEQLTRPIRGPTDRVRVLDFGCGYGAFLAMCQLYGFEAVGVDRASAKLDNNLFKDVYAELDEVKPRAPFHALTLFQVLEHLDDPKGLMTELSELLPKGGILVLETPDCTGVSDIRSRYDYEKIHPLEHVNGFTPKTLRQFAMRLGFEPIATPVACVTTEATKAVRSMVRRLIRPLIKPTTDQYFRKL